MRSAKRIQDAETTEQWAIQRKLIEGDVREDLALYPALERIDVDRSFDQFVRLCHFGHSLWSYCLRTDPGGRKSRR